MNELGEVCGKAAYGAASDYIPFVYSGGQMIGYRGPKSTALALNNRGLVVGEILRQGLWRAFVIDRSRENRVVDLNALVPGGSSWWLLRATDVNDANQIVCLAANSVGVVHVVVLHPMVQCDADVNRDGFVDFFDYLDFVNAFDAGSQQADFNSDGFLDFFDYDEFVITFEAGC